MTSTERYLGSSLPYPVSLGSALCRDAQLADTQTLLSMVLLIMQNMKHDRPVEQELSAGDGQAEIDLDRAALSIGFRDGCALDAAGVGSCCL